MVAKALAVQQPPIACVSLLAGGSTSARSDAVQRFRDEEDVRVFLLSLNAGAQGLTLVRGAPLFLIPRSNNQWEIYLGKDCNFFVFLAGMPLMLAPLRCTVFSAFV